MIIAQRNLRTETIAAGFNLVIRKLVVQTQIAKNKSKSNAKTKKLEKIQSALEHIDRPTLRSHEK